MIAKIAAIEALSVGDGFTFAGLSEPAPRALELFPEVQVAVQAARASSVAAISMAYSMNTLRKIAEGKAVSGKFTAEAQDCLRSALLFSGAGLDTALKRLAAEAIPILVVADRDVAHRLEEFAEHEISDPSGGASPKELIRLLLGAGETPRDVMVRRWIDRLERESAQSAARVTEIASALGVTDATLRKRIAQTKNRSTTLEKAFAARNEIAHELDVTKPEEAARKRLESIRRYRNVDAIIAMCREILDVTQDIVNDVVERVAALEAKR